MRFDGKTNKQVIEDLVLTKVSNVPTPAHGPAIVKIIKAGDPAPGALGADKNKNKNKSEEQAMPEDIKKAMEEMEARLKKAETLATFSDVEKAYMGELKTDGEKDAFLLKSATERKAILDGISKKAEEKKKAEELLKAGDETISLHGQEIKKSVVGPGVFAVMKAQEELLAKSIKAQNEMKESIIQKSLEDRAEKLWPNTAGTAADKAIMLKTIESLPENLKKTQMDMMKAADNALAQTFQEVGANHENVAKGEEIIQKMADGFQKANPLMTPAQAYAKSLRTPAGIKAYEDMQRS